MVLCSQNVASCCVARHVITALSSSGNAVLPLLFLDAMLWRRVQLGYAATRWQAAPGLASCFLRRQRGAALRLPRAGTAFGAPRPTLTIVIWPVGGQVGTAHGGGQR